MTTPMFDVASRWLIWKPRGNLRQLERRTVRASAFYMSSSGKGQAGLVPRQKRLTTRVAMHGGTATDDFTFRRAPPGSPTKRAGAGLEPTVTESEILNGHELRRSGLRHSQRGRRREATKLFARTEGVILDPVYTGKAPPE